MGKGGGSVDIPQRKAGPEWQDIKKFFGGQENQYEAFTQKDPLLSMLYPGAQDYFNSPTSPLLSELQKQGLVPASGRTVTILQQFLNQGAMGQDPLFQSLNQRAMTQDPLLQSLNQRAMTYDPSKLLGDLN